MANIRFKYFILCIIGIVLLVPGVFYFVTFNNSTISNDPDRWGVFGDYIGGTLNPIVGVLNLILLVIVAWYVATREDNRLINEFRYKVYSELVSKFDDAFYNGLVVNNIEKLEKDLQNFAVHNQFLFEENKELLKMTTDKLLKNISDLIIAIEEDNNATTGVNVFPESRKKRIELFEAFQAMSGLQDTPVSIAYSNFLNSKNSLIDFICRSMLNKPQKAK